VRCSELYVCYLKHLFHSYSTSHRTALTSHILTQNIYSTVSSVPIFVMRVPPSHLSLTPPAHPADNLGTAHAVQAVLLHMVLIFLLIVRPYLVLYILYSTIDSCLRTCIKYKGLFLCYKNYFDLQELF
jgi:hypothetical protein